LLKINSNYWLTTTVCLLFLAFLYAAHIINPITNNAIQKTIKSLLLTFFLYVSNSSGRTIKEL